MNTYKFFILQLSFCLLMGLCMLTACSGDNQEAPIVSADLLSVGSVIDVSGAGATGENLSVESNANWTVTSSVTWIQITSPSAGQGSGNGNVVFNVEESSLSTSRNGSLTIVSSDGIKRTITVTQRAGNIKLTVTPSSLTYQYAGGDRNLHVECNTSWTAVCSINDLTISGSGITAESNGGVTTYSGEGNADITVHAAENTTADDISGQITFKDLDGQAESVVVDVTIGGRKPYITVTNPSSDVIPAAGGTFTFSVSSNFNWQCDLNATWARFQNGKQMTTGEYNSEPLDVELRIDPNTTESDRQLIVTGRTRADIGENAVQTVTVTQAAGTVPTIGTVTVSDVTHVSVTITFPVATTTFAVTAAGVRLSETETGSANGTVFPAFISSGIATVNLTGLTPGTTYYFVPFASNDVGTKTGTTVGNFTTGSIPGHDDNNQPTVED